MVVIYRVERQQIFGVEGEIVSKEIFRFFDMDEVPDDIEERVERWANHFLCELALACPDEELQYFKPCESSFSERGVEKSGLDSLSLGSTCLTDFLSVGTVSDGDPNKKELGK